MEEKHAQIPETAWHLALEELGDVEENCEEQDGEEVGEQVVPVLSCVLLPSGDNHEDEDDGHDDVDKNIAQDQLPVVSQGIVDSHVALQGNSDLLGRRQKLLVGFFRYGRAKIMCCQYCLQIVQIICKVSG